MMFVPTVDIGPQLLETNDLNDLLPMTVLDKTDRPKTLCQQFKFQVKHDKFLSGKLKPKKTTCVLPKYQLL